MEKPKIDREEVDHSFPAGDPPSHGSAGERTGDPDRTRNRVVQGQPGEDVGPVAPVPPSLPPDVGR